MEHFNEKLKKALHFFNQGYYMQAEIYYLECLDQIDENNEELYKEVLHGLGNVKMEMEQFSAAIEQFSKLLKMAKLEGSKEQAAKAYHQLGIVQRKTRNYNKALNFLANEKEIYDTFLPDFHLGYAKNLYESGTIQMLQNNFEVAVEMLRESVKHAEKIGDLMVLGKSYRNLGDVYQALGKQQEAMVFYQSALEAFHRGDEDSGTEEIKGRMVGLLHDME